MDCLIWTLSRLEKKQLFAKVRKECFVDCGQRLLNCYSFFSDLSLPFSSTLRLLTISQKQYRSVLSQFHDKNPKNDRTDSKGKEKILIGSLVAGIFGGYFYFYKQKNVAIAERKKTGFGAQARAGKFREDLPIYSLDEVDKHTANDNRIWVTYKEGVYDITDFIEGHPGGDQIMMAAGSSVEPFWMLYGIHENEHVYEILETMRIGNLSKQDQDQMTSDMDDPYANDPKRHVILKPASVKPFNAESPLVLLCENFITPNELFYVRNHLPVPDIDPKSYALEVEVEGHNRWLTLTLEDLKRLPRHTITATIMCAGNRRSEMTKIKPVKGLNWGAAAIGNATWTGVRLRDVLERVGVTENEEKLKHVQFEGADFDVAANNYGASIPLWRAVAARGDVLLAYEMNGVPIPRDHGFPIRVLVPGVVGARNVKWLTKVVVSEKESRSHWQQNDYKGFSPSTDWDTVDFKKSPAIQELPVISAICKPCDGDTVEVERGHIAVKGYAWSGGGQKIVRVDVSADRGETWHVASLDVQDSAEPPRHWAWTLWSVRVPVVGGSEEAEIWAKAVDSSYNTQPESFANIWNLRGVLGNAYHRVTVRLATPP
ncbi:sulfite oxidase isoform X2 [Cylas formicarius]|uniref:sulfite oxidase isoform X2 n=1 Tax=Cylas formicarius TaxID=197179 RepID=UPI002958A440|nr:sulfite oxidase isoform X2 [Cylas formicarius]